LTSQELRSLTLRQLEEKSLNRGATSSSEKKLDENSVWLSVLLGGIFDEGNIKNSLRGTIVSTNDLINDDVKILIIPGIYGAASDAYMNLGKQLLYPAFILQLHESVDCTDIDQIAEILAPSFLSFFEKTKQYVLVGHSFGTVLSLKVANILEKNGKSGHVIQLDGSPQYIHRFANKIDGGQKDVEKLNLAISITLFEILAARINDDRVKKAYLNHSNWEERLEALVRDSQDVITVSMDDVKKYVGKAFTERLKISLFLEEKNFESLKTSKISLIKASKSTIHGIHSDYGLGKFSPQPIEIDVIEGDHITILNNEKLPEVIMNLLYF
jgi:thioesterase domain-containing protein